MNAPTKKLYRKRRLFPRSLQEVVKDATQPMMNKQGKLYGALLRDWTQIVGVARAAVTRPQRLQFSTTDGQEAILHLAVRPAAAPEIIYAQEQILEQCARYFGYRAVGRLVLHQTHGTFDEESVVQPTASTPREMSAAALPASVPAEMRGVFERLAAHVASSSDKKN
jgi:hypothetical protein